LKADIDHHCWPIFRLGEALEALARSSGLSSEYSKVPHLPVGELSADDEALSDWLEAAATELGIETQSTRLRYAELDVMVAQAGPALFRVGEESSSPGFLAILGKKRQKLRLLGPDLKIRRVSVAAVCSALSREFESAELAEIDALLTETGVPPRHGNRTRRALLNDRLGQERIGACWQLRPGPWADIRLQLSHAGLLGNSLVIGCLHTLQYGLWLLAWWIIGKAVLQGYVDPGWLLAWTLLLLTLVPLRMWIAWLQGRLSLGFGALLKQRLLYGALCFTPEDVRHQGVGQLLGRIIESEAIERLALTGGILGLVAIVELIVTTAVLSLSDASRFHGIFLLLWLAVALLLGWGYWMRCRDWADARIEMTHELVENLVGHRTRLAQKPDFLWHVREDRKLDHYLNLSSSMDRKGTWLVALVPRGWLVLGLVGLSPAVITDAVSPEAAAVGLGGVILAFRALDRLMAGLFHLTGAAVAWRQVQPVFAAAVRPSACRVRPLNHSTLHPGRPLLDAHELVFRYAPNDPALLNNCTLQIFPGDRLLLGGRSGSGKSTLSSILSGLRRPESGLLLITGFDRPTLGFEGWRRHVAIASQFHDNYVLTGTFAFNLLMGRRWPPRPEDLEEAEEICRDLGLGALLDTMPAGMMQMVGESGWQLSHGEKSRLYIARTLLQDACLLIFDESFAALDPGTLHAAMKCAFSRAPALLVIAHP
jgi:ATP-binding cassette, subfamily B, bacterial